HGADSRDDPRLSLPQALGPEIDCCLDYFRHRYAHIDVGWCPWADAGANLELGRAAGDAPARFTVTWPRIPFRRLSGARQTFVATDPTLVILDDDRVGPRLAAGGSAVCSVYSLTATSSCGMVNRQIRTDAGGADSVCRRLSCRSHPRRSAGCAFRADRSRKGLGHTRMEG